MCMSPNVIYWKKIPPETTLTHRLSISGISGFGKKMKYVVGIKQVSAISMSHINTL